MSRESPLRPFRRVLAVDALRVPAILGFASNHLFLSAGFTIFQSHANADHLYAFSQDAAIKKDMASREKCLRTLAHPMHVLEGMNKIILVPLVGLAAAGSLAHGQGVPSATGSYLLGDAYGNGQGEGLVVTSSTSVNFASPVIGDFPANTSPSTARVSLNFSTQPSISATASTIDGGGEGLGASAILDYYFEVEYLGSGQADSAVPLDIDGSLYVSDASSGVGGDSRIEVSGESNPYDSELFGLAQLDPQGGNQQPGTQVFDFQGDANVGWVYTVDMRVQAGAGNALTGTNSVTSSVDPSITLDTDLSDWSPNGTDNNPADYAIVLSSNLAPASGVPDAASSLGLLVAGLALLAPFNPRLWAAATTRSSFSAGA
jgi:hypothetical protein